MAGVLKRQMDDARTVGADHVVATDDDSVIANLAPLDAVADTVGGRTAGSSLPRSGQEACMHRLSSYRRTPRSTHL